MALQVLDGLPERRADLETLQRNMAEVMEREVSSTQAVTAAAWLYLLGAVELEEGGVLTPCN
jgi:hypothetical protein